MGHFMLFSKFVYFGKFRSLAAEVICDLSWWGALPLNFRDSKAVNSKKLGMRKNGTSLLRHQARIGHCAPAGAEKDVFVSSLCFWSYQSFCLR